MPAKSGWYGETLGGSIGRYVSIFHHPVLLLEFAKNCVTKYLLFFYYCELIHFDLSLEYQGLDLLFTYSAEGYLLLVVIHSERWEMVDVILTIDNSAWIAQNWYLNL